MNLNILYGRKARVAKTSVLLVVAKKQGTEVIHVAEIVKMTCKS